MGKVMIHATMSLDGFIARSNDELADWAFNYGPDEIVNEVMKDIGAVVLGKKTFQVSLDHDQLPYGGAIKVPNYIVTHEYHKPEKIGGLTFYFIVGGLDSAVELAKQAAGMKAVSLLGASIDQQCLKLGLVDEIVVHIVPVVLGSGIRLFENLESGPYKLELVKMVTGDGVTSARYRVVKQTSTK